MIYWGNGTTENNDNIQIINDLPVGEIKNDKTS